MEHNLFLTSISPRIEIDIDTTVEMHMYIYDIFC